MSYFNEPEKPGCYEHCGDLMRDCGDGCGNCSMSCRQGLASCLVNCCSYGTPAPIDSGSEVLPPWRKLWVEFVNRVTWHGLKYTELRSRFIIRRFIWTIILLITVSLFLYINSTKLMYLLTYPVTINLNVIYNNTLPFPAVTICNANQYRLTALHEMGLLDLMVNDVDSSNCKVCSEYVLYTEVCWSKRIDSEGFFSSSFKEVSRRVCMSLCTSTYDTKCSGFFYYRLNRTCLLSSYTGEWVDAKDPPCPKDSGTEFYRRNRNISLDSIVCTFEESSCLFINEIDSSDSWYLEEAKNSPVAKDNTLNLGSGHINSLLATEQKAGYQAELSSPYLNTTGMCLELFYWFQADKANLGEVPSVTVWTEDEEKVRRKINSTSKFIQDWSRFFVILPEGINQIVIEGTRARAGTNGISLDDINVWKCEMFTKYRNCKVSRKGIAYMGNINVSSTGQPCLRWNQVRSPLVYKLPDQFAKDAVNHCRYIPQENWEEPSCFVRSGDSVEISPCNVPFCNCSDKNSFTCDKGLCLPSNLLCNGIQDCIDGTDELEACVGLMKLDCNFDDDFICGYKKSKVGSLSWEQRSSGALISFTSTSIYHNVSTLAYMMFLDSTYGQVGDQVQLVSPRTNFSRPTLVSFDYIMSSTSDLTDNGVSGLYLYLFSILHTPLQMLFKKTNFNDTMFMTAQVCAPSGQYYLMFLGVQGRLYEQAIALPSVKILGGCVPNSNSRQNEPLGPSGLNCKFTGMCPGYSFLSSSAYFNYTFDYTENIMSTYNNGPACSNIFNGVEGVITSPGYPTKYPDNTVCTFEILEPDGATITVNFLEFSIEAESDCLFDRLEVYDPVVNITRFFCGHNIPPPIKSRGNRLKFNFRSDNSENFGRFKMAYVATAKADTEFSLVYKYVGPSLLHGYNHLARLMSPIVSISEKSCLIAEVIVLSMFRVITAYEDKDTGNFMETTIFSIPRSLGKQWHNLFLDLDPSKFKDNRVVIIFEVEIDHLSTLEPAAVRKTSLISKMCKDSVTNPSLDCDFDKIDQCGYLDASPGKVHWTRFYSQDSQVSFMSAYFEKSDKDPAVLRSSRISVDSNKCLSVTYDTSDSVFEMEISSSLSSSTASRYQLNTDDSASLRFDIQKGSQEITFKVYPSSSGEYSRWKDGEVNIQNIATLDGLCPTSEKQADLNCDFDNLFICNFKASTTFGGTWLWSPYAAIVSYGDQNGTDPGKPHVTSSAEHGSVMLYNDTGNNYRGVLTSPPILVNNTITVRFEALTTNRNLTRLQVYYGSALGQVTGKLIDVQFDDDLTWKNFSICLPAVNTYLFFVASVSPTHFVIVDNIFSNSDTCTPLVSDPNTVCSSTGNNLDCPGTLFTWSSSFKWINTSAIQNNFDPDKDGCMYVYDRSEGTFQFRQTGKHEANKTECDLYIRGKGRMMVTLSFPQFEARDCAAQYVEVWEHRADSPPTFSRKICARESLNLTVDDLVQLHILSTKGYPRFTMNYSYTIASASAYSSGLYYTPGLATSSLRGVATWTTPIRKFSKSTICLRVDTALLMSSLDIQAFYQYEGAVVKQMGVYFATNYANQQRDWTNGTFQVSFDPLSANQNNRITVQFLFIFSLALDNPLNSSSFDSALIAALNNVRLSESECSDTTISQSPPICLLDSKNFCGFTDESSGTSRWTRVSLRSDFARAGDCRSKEDGSTYVGPLATTISGRVCQPWALQTPQKHNQDASEYFPDPSISAAGNKCRNPQNPFIPRSCWCYTTDVKQRREYCDIPLCLDKYFQVEFDASMSSATLVSAPFSITKSYCFAFQYILTSPFIQLEVYAIDDKGNEIILQEFSMGSQYTVDPGLTESRSSAPVGYVTLDPGIRKVKFVTKKLDNQTQIHVLLSNITSYDGSCSSVLSERMMAPSDRVPYTGPKASRTDFKKQIFDSLKDWNIRNLTEVLAHQEMDLIHKCSYDNSECTDTDIITRQTDMGQCYTFNKDALRVTSTSGLEYGAKFILNIEQYEHVVGYASGEGVKLQLHDHDDIPSMKDLSVAALPGVHNLGIASYTKSENLESPFGRCGMFPLDYYDLVHGEPYSEARCKLERKTKKVERKCGCADAYMPGYTRFCDLNETMTCLSKTVSRTLASQCPTPCQLNSYTIQITQIGLSGLGISDLLDNRSTEVESKYLRALNLKHRVGKDMTNLYQLLEDFFSKLNEFKDHVYFSILDSQTSTLYHVQSAIMALFQLSVDDVKLAGKGLISDLRQNYVRFGSSRATYLEEYLKESQSRLAYYKDLSQEANTSTVKNSTSNDRFWHLTSVNLTLTSLTDLGNILSTYEFVTGSDDSSVGCTDFIDKSLLEVCKCSIQSLSAGIEPMVELLKRALDLIVKNSGSTSEWTSLVDDESLNGLMSAIVEVTSCTSQLETTTNNLNDWVMSEGFSSINIRNVSLSINPQSTLITINFVKQWLEQLKSNYSLSTITKRQLALSLSGDEVAGALRNISNIVLDVTQNILSPIQDNIFAAENLLKSNYQNFLFQCQKLYNITMNTKIEEKARSLIVWRKPQANLELPENINFMLKSQETWQVWPKEQTLSDFYPDRSKIRLTFILDSYFDILKNEVQAFTSQLNGYHDKVKTSMASLETELGKYLKETEINEDFLRSNFLMLDIYYGDMKYSDIVMKQAYGWIDFFSNVGGYFGLLMGCSVITMCEVLDFFVYHSAVKLYEKVEQRSRKRRHVIHVDPSDDPGNGHKSVRFLEDIEEEPSDPKPKFKNPLNFNL